MPQFVPSGYLSMRDALDRVGRKLFQEAWTGEEHKACRGLISKDEWLGTKDLPPARGGGAGIERPPSTKPLTPHSTGDPSDPSYQEEYRARERYIDAQDQLRQMLEAGELEVAILNPWTGKLHQASASLWRQHNADRMIEKAQAPIPGSSNTGELLVKQFADANESKKPIPQTKIQDAIEALKQKIATESLTRSEQADFLRKTFPSYHLTERQLIEIFRAVPGADWPAQKIRHVSLAKFVLPQSPYVLARGQTIRRGKRIH